MKNNNKKEFLMPGLITADLSFKNAFAQFRSKFTEINDPDADMLTDDSRIPKICMRLQYIWKNDSSEFLILNDKMNMNKKELQT